MQNNAEDALILSLDSFLSEIDGLIYKPLL